MTLNSFYPTHWKLHCDAVIAYRHPHVMRHTYATELLWKGQSPVLGKEQLGHSSSELPWILVITPLEVVTRAPWISSMIPTQVSASETQVTIFEASS